MPGQTRAAGIVVLVLGLALGTVGCGNDNSSSAPDASTTSGSGDLPPGDDTTIERHLDGDTIGVRGGERVRLIGIDTPETQDPREPVQCFGKEASDFIAELVPLGTEVRLVYDVERLDRYGRTLAYLYRLDDGVFVNAELVRRGFAIAYTFPPNVAHSDEFVEFAANAREAERGLWSSCPDSAAPSTVASSSSACDLSYPGRCIPPPPPDLDCGDVSDRAFPVTGGDPHAFDGDGNGIGCEQVSSGSAP